MALLRLRLNHRALTKCPPLTHLFSSSSSDPSEPKLDSSDLRHQPTTTPHMDDKVSSGKGGGESERVVKTVEDLRQRLLSSRLRIEAKHKMKMGQTCAKDRETERKSVVKMEESEAQHLGGTRRISIEDLRQSLCGLKIEEKKDTKQKMKMGQTRDNMMKPAKKEGLVEKNFHPKNMPSAKKLKGEVRDESEAQQSNVNDVEKEGLPRLSDRETERKSVVKMEESEAKDLGEGLSKEELRPICNKDKVYLWIPRAPPGEELTLEENYRLRLVEEDIRNGGDGRIK